MSYRCTNAFVSGSNVYGGGVLVKDDDPILKTHAAHFVKVNEPVRGGETTSAAPNELRAPAQSGDDVAAWLAAEEAHKSDVQAWLAAEKEHAVQGPPVQEPAAPKKATQPRRPRVSKQPS